MCSEETAAAAHREGQRGERRVCLGLKDARILRCFKTHVTQWSPKKAGNTTENISQGLPCPFQETMKRLPLNRY